MELLPLAERVAKTALNRVGVQSRWAETSVGKLHFYDAPGSGPLPTVVLLHGICSSALPYAPVLQRLRPRVRRILAPEAPGHGSSSPPNTALTPESLFTALSELLDRELDEPAIIVGNSLGGAVALNYALTAPDRVRALVLASPAGASMERPELDLLLGAFKLRSRGDANSFMSRIYHRVPWFAPLFAGDLVRQFSREVIVSFTGAVRNDHAFTPEQLAALVMPILLIWGRSDRLLPSANLEYFRRHLPSHARIEQPEGMGHSPHMDAPHRIADMIAAFAADAQAGRHRGVGAARAHGAS